MRGKRSLMSYVPQKYRPLIEDLYREYNDCDGTTVICVCMEWEDGFSRAFVCDSISEMVWAIKNTAEDREFQF